MASRKEQKERARQERLAAEQAAAARAAKRRRLQLGGGVGAAIIAGIVIAIVAASSGSSSSTSSTSTTPLSTTPVSSAGKLRPAPSPGALGIEGVPVPSGPTLAAPAFTGATVDGIKCNSTEQLVFHIHSHLTIFVNGMARQVPQYVGFDDNTCLHWLHTHAPDGIIHVESPEHRTFTLGNFFDIWGQPLGPTRAGPATGKVTAFYNGALYRGDPRDIPLTSHAQIQLDVGTPLIAPEKISFAGTGL